MKQITSNQAEEGNDPHSGLVVNGIGVIPISKAGTWAMQLGAGFENVH